MKKWITSLVLGPNTALSKIHSDIVEIARQEGYEPLYIFSYNDEKESDEALNARIDGITACVSQGDLVLHLSPFLNSFRFSQRFIHKMKARGTHYVTGVIDSEFLRYPARQRENNAFIGRELELFQEAEAVLVHGKAMADALKNEGLKSHVIERGPFDYLTEAEEVKLSGSLERKICFVGNPFKSDFLERWDYKTPLMAFYPKGSEEVSAPSVEVMGHENFFERIPRNRFGIFWESGHNYQAYSRYTAPHKCALYMTLGMPIIAWSGAHIAQFIEKEGIGFTVNSIDEIDQKLASLTTEELKDMKRKANRMSYRIRTGFYTKNALAQLEQGIFHGVWTD